MREYTAKYNTKSMKGVEYSFKAENLQEAIKFAQDKFSAYPEIEIFDDTDTQLKPVRVLSFLRQVR